MKVYISGMVTGLPAFIYRKQFERAELKLRLSGYNVYNPVKYDAKRQRKRFYLGAVHEKRHKSFMRLRCNISS